MRYVVGTIGLVLVGSLNAKLMDCPKRYTHELMLPKNGVLAPFCCYDLKNPLTGAYVDEFNCHERLEIAEDGPPPSSNTYVPGGAGGGGGSSGSGGVPRQVSNDSLRRDTETLKRQGCKNRFEIGFVQALVDPAYIERMKKPRAVGTDNRGVTVGIESLSIFSDIRVEVKVIDKKGRNQEGESCGAPKVDLAVFTKHDDAPRDSPGTSVAAAKPMTLVPQSERVSPEGERTMKFFIVLKGASANNELPFGAKPQVVEEIIRNRNLTFQLKQPDADADSPGAKGDGSAYLHNCVQLWGGDPDATPVRFVFMRNKSAQWSPLELKALTDFAARRVYGPGARIDPYRSQAKRFEIFVDIAEQPADVGGFNQNFTMGDQAAGELAQKVINATSCVSTVGVAYTYIIGTSFPAANEHAVAIGGKGVMMLDDKWAAGVKTNPDHLVHILEHEPGHTFGHLADEYDIADRRISNNTGNHWNTTYNLNLYNVPNCRVNPDDYDNAAPNPVRGCGWFSERTRPSTKPPFWKPTAMSVMNKYPQAGSSRFNVPSCAAIMAGFDDKEPRQYWPDYVDECLRMNVLKN